MSLDKFRVGGKQGNAHVSDTHPSAPLCNHEKPKHTEPDIEEEILMSTDLVLA